MQLRPGKTLIVLLLGCSLLSVAIGAGVAMFLGSKAQAGAHKSDKEHKEEHPEPKMIHSLGEMVINLSDQGELRYAKVGVAVGFKDKLHEEEIKELDPVLKDTVLHVVTEKSFKELHRKNGISGLKKELLKGLEHNVPKHPVVAVYFESFAMQ